MMYQEILLSVTGKHIDQLIFWGMSLMTGMLTLRAIHDFMIAFTDCDADMTVVEAIRKVRKRIYAVVIAITAESTILFFKHFYM